jgi:hypothetical protein
LPKNSKLRNAILTAIRKRIYPDNRLRYWLGFKKHFEAFQSRFIKEATDEEARKAAEAEKARISNDKKVSKEEKRPTETQASSSASSLSSSSKPDSKKSYSDSDSDSDSDSEQRHSTKSKNVLKDGKKTSDQEKALQKKIALIEKKIAALKKKL